MHGVGVGSVLNGEEYLTLSHEVASLEVDASEGAAHSSHHIHLCVCGYEAGVCLVQGHGIHLGYRYGYLGGLPRGIRRLVRNLLAACDKQKRRRQGRD